MLKIFLDYVEIRTKIATVIPFIIATLLYAFLFESHLNYLTLIIFFIALLLLDMSTTALNNYVSLTRAETKNHLDNELLTLIDQKKITKHQLLYILLSLFIVGTVLSFVLVFLTNYFVLLLGLLCGFIAITYSYGPLPVFRTPLGELYSATADGLIIPFLVFFSQSNDIGIVFEDFILQIDLLKVISYGLLFMPMFFIVSNIMLANNICDMEEDLKNERYTLPNVLGKKYSLIVWKYSYILAILIIAVCALLPILPLYFVIILLLLIPVIKNIKIFEQKQDKRTTFFLSLKNFMIISSAYIILLISALILQFFKII